MQSLKYVDVLNTLAYKLGYDPLDPNFPRDEAQALGTYIDQWVTRTYPSRDWPEWTHVMQFEPNADHIVPWNAITVDPSFTTQRTLDMWRVMAVYLVDPKSVYGANSTKFYLKEEGVHCGFEHGPSVWIKFIEPPPRFTSTEWDANTVYKKGDPVFSLKTGNVYKSKSNNNRNHDPAVGFSLGGGAAANEGGSTFVQTDVLQDKAISQLGTPGQNKIMKVSVDRLAPNPGGSTVIPDPPALGSVFDIAVMDSTGVILAASTAIGNGVLTLSAIAASLVTQLSTGLGGGWSVTAGSPDASVIIENASDFMLINPSSGTDYPKYFANPTAPAAPLNYVQLQAYIATASSATVTPQVIQTTFSVDQLIAGALYSFEFKDLQGQDHVFEYQSMSGDGQDQIIGGILAAVPNAALTDNYFETIQVSSDATPSVTFTLNDHASLNSLLILPGSPWWEVVPFPLALKEQVVRGAYADALKDWGQADKAAVEEQAVSAESEASARKFTFEPTLPLTQQVNIGGRYRS